MPDTDTDTSRSTPRPTRAAALAGIAVPLVFLPTLALVTWLEYDFMTSLGWTFWGASEEVPYPSALARGPYGWMHVANSVVTGMLALVLVAGLHGQYRRRVSGLAATVLLAMFGIAGLLDAAPTDLPGEQSSAAGTVHFVGFLMTMAGGVFGTLAAGLALRGNPDWRGWWLYSALTGPAMVLVAAGLLGPPNTINFFVFAAVLWGGFGVMGARLHRLATRA